jgi:hypothetical protein
MSKLIITESEKRNILSMYNNQIIDENVVFTDWLSPDEKYVIFLDELYDIENKTKLGNIWENFDNFKFFLKHSFEVSELPNQIKEDFNNSYNSTLITESVVNGLELKNTIKTLMTEGLWDSFKNWAVETGKSSYEGFKEFVGTMKNLPQNLKNLANKISKSEWLEAFKIIGKGARYIARKIRGAMYHPIGLILDAILVATEVGKLVQWIPWAIIVALDIYELISGDYEEEMSMLHRFLFLGVDILGLVFAGVTAKSAKMGIKAALGAGKTVAEIAPNVAKSPMIKGLLTKMVTGASKVGPLLEQAVTILSVKFPPAAKFISSILGGLAGIIKKLVSFISEVLKLASKPLKAVIPGSSKLAKGTRAAVGTTALVGGVGTYGEYKKEKSNKELSNTLRTAKVNYGADDV